MTTRLVMLAVVLAAVCPVPSALALLRAQNVSICDPTTGSYAGYFHPEHVETKGYFYWFFPSRNDPATDPVVLWMTGGPGCSSQLALLTENGPCGVAKDGSTTIRNGYSWTNNASVIWIDQPAGVGYSYGKPSDYDHNEAQVSQDMVSFLDEFMAYFSDYASNPFYVFGESYGGHYVPATAFAVWNASKTGTGPKINLKGLGIGNGLVAPEIQYALYPDMAYNNSVKPLVSKGVYEVMEAAVKGCVSEINKCQQTDGVACSVAYEGCNLAEVTPVQETGVNLYDIRIPCEKPPLCYDFSAEDKFLNLASTKAALGVDTSRTWQSCNMAVNAGFRKDWMQHFQVAFPPMLADGLRVLIYNGDVDYICNWMGDKAMTLALEWPNKSSFNNEGDHPWLKYGEARSSNGLTFLKVFEAGHMVPRDQPVAALLMLNTFLADKPFY